MYSLFALGNLVMEERLRNYSASLCLARNHAEGLRRSNRLRLDRTLAAVQLPFLGSTFESINGHTGHSPLSAARAGVSLNALVA